jgi:aminoglycoside phosphotransferase (APT) family kinase protein
MHADEIETDIALVRRLLAVQFPRWADLPIEPVVSAGTVNAIYRLGDDLVMRLPRVQSGAGDLKREYSWLPKLAPHLPLAVPEPLAMGAPAEGYPWHWAIYRWLQGEIAASRQIADLNQAAIDLARFIAALQRIDPAGGAPSTRGVLAMRDAGIRTEIASLDGAIDASAATAAWEASRRAPTWDDMPVWTHGDLLPTNLLVEQGRLSAVIDFGSVGTGDPALDLLCAWSVLSAETRDVFRSTLSVDDATWVRGRGFALSWALNVLPYYRDTNPVLASTARYMIGEVLADQESSAWHEPGETTLMG